MILKISVEFYSTNPIGQQKQKGKILKTIDACVGKVVKAALPLLCVTLKWVRRATVTTFSNSVYTNELNNFQYQNPMALEMLLTNQDIWKSKWMN